MAAELASTFNSIRSCSITVDGFLILMVLVILEVNFMTQKIKQVKSSRTFFVLKTVRWSFHIFRALRR